MTPLAAPRPKIRVLCVDDSLDAAEMLDRCIAFQPDMESAGTLRSADELCAEVVARRVDVVVLDLTMPGKDPLEALSQLTALCDRRGLAAAIHTVVYSGRTDAHTRCQAAAAGAWAMVSKDAAITSLLDTIRASTHGDTLQTQVA